MLMDNNIRLVRKRKEGEKSRRGEKASTTLNRNSLRHNKFNASFSHGNGHKTQTETSRSNHLSLTFSLQSLIFNSRTKSDNLTTIQSDCRSVCGKSANFHRIYEFIDSTELEYSCNHNCTQWHLPAIIIYHRKLRFHLNYPHVIDGFLLCACGFDKVSQHNSIYSLPLKMSI